MTLKKDFLVIPSAHRNSDNNMLYFIKKIKTVRMVRSKLRESRQGVTTSAGIWPELTQSLREGQGDVQGPFTLLHIHTRLHNFTLQLNVCKNNLTPEDYHRHNGAHSLFICAP